MKNKLFTFGISGVFILLIYLFTDIMISPGELVKGHHDLNQKCSSCHELFFGTPNDRCIACHKLDEIGKNADTVEMKKTLFHEFLGNQKCSACHTDHKGINPENQYKGFDHSLLDKTTMNRCGNCHSSPADSLHTRFTVECSKCHTTGGWKSGAGFDHNLLQLVEMNNCKSCHKQPNDSFHGTFDEACSTCHSTNKWVPATFEHSSYFILDNDHNVACNICHTNKEFGKYTCYGCHEHTPDNIMKEHDEEGIADLNDCVRCHKSADEDDVKSEGRDGSEHENDD
ncbi:MAG: class III cytochrome C family protein [Bacteroidales bacterium]|nr:class III cytochrome C family protein [Bacteroidales bacterium]